jgi:hypothetical protein
MPTYYGTDKDRLTALVTATNKVLERPTPATPTPVDIEAQREDEARRLAMLRNPPRGR